MTKVTSAMHKTLNAKKFIMKPRVHPMKIQRMMILMTMKLIVMKRNMIFILLLENLLQLLSMLMANMKVIVIKNLTVMKTSLLQMYFFPNQLLINMLIQNVTPLKMLSKKQRKGAATQESIMYSKLERMRSGKLNIMGKLCWDQRRKCRTGSADIWTEESPSQKLVS